MAKVVSTSLSVDGRITNCLGRFLCASMCRKRIRSSWPYLSGISNAEKSGTKSDDVWMYEVNNLNAIRENVIPFFHRFGFLSAKKKRDFAIFQQMAELMADRCPSLTRGHRISC